jgi:hypothetical protein
MQFRAPSEFLNVMDVTGESVFDKSNTGYISGSDLFEESRLGGSRTEYYLKEAKERGTKERIKDYIDPLGFQADFTQQESFWLNITSHTQIMFVDLSLLKLLAQDKDIGMVSGDHEYELVVLQSGDDSAVSQLKKELSEQDGIQL